ncbi:MAG: alanine racemase [Deltaproteobacteria bacterium]|nr:alanine racemase [Candidatus Zymogenaceae bacterium]
MFDERVLRDTRALVNLDAVKSVVRHITAAAGNGVSVVMAVVKADGYGHGAVQIANAALSSGASSLAVAYPQEVLELRTAGIDAHTLVMGLLPAGNPDVVDIIVKTGAAQTVADTDAPLTLGASASADRPVPVHIKVDTGMGRIGIPPEDVLSYIEFLKTIPGIVIEGIFTHFPSADEADLSFTSKQITIFKDLIQTLEGSGINIPFKHMANSAGILALRNAYINMVRPGIMLYGLYPSSEVEKSIPLTPALRLVSAVRYLKRVPAGTPISYGRTFVTSRPSVIATLPVGYADGYNRLLSNRGSVLVRGMRAPITGRICMDMTMIDVTDIEGVAVGDEAVLIGPQENDEITADEMAGLLGTINYEVTCAISKRVPRVYIDDGKGV